MPAGLFFYSTSRITLRRFRRSSACTTSLLSSTASRRSHRSLGVPAVFPQDAPGVLNGANDGILVGIVHDGTPTPRNQDSRWGDIFRFPLALRALDHGPVTDLRLSLPRARTCSRRIRYDQRRLDRFSARQARQTSRLAPLASPVSRQIG